MSQDADRACLLHARPLFGGEYQGAWSCSGGTLPESQAPAAAHRLLSARCARQERRRPRATRCGKDKLPLGDAVSVLTRRCAGVESVGVVPVGGVSEERDALTFFRTAAFFYTGLGTADAIVQPFNKAFDGTLWNVHSGTYMYLPLLTRVCRALLLHACGRLCDESINGVVHGVENVWKILGRAEGYPGRSGYPC